MAIETAAQKYATRAANIQRLLAELAADLKAHQEVAELEPRNWGLVGDLANVEELLQRATDFMNGRD